MLGCAAASAGPALAETLSVPGDFSTIQAAIDAADENDVVLVEPGRYSENLVLKSGVDVVGRETARTLLEPDDDSMPTVTIESSTAVRFSNFTLIESSIGVSVRLSSSIDIANVVFDRVRDVGLDVDASSVEAVNNVFFENGVAIQRLTTSVEIVNNIFAGNDTAIATTSVPAPFENVRSNCFFRNGALPADSDGEAGTGSVFGDPRFVSPDARDFHLREGSACIDIGRGLDAIDSTTADAGAYGGELADVFPFPVGQPTLRAVGSAADGFGLEASWNANLDYRVTSTTNPGGYRVYYKRGAPPQSPADYDGDDAANGTSPIDAGAATSLTLEGLDAAVTPPLPPRLIDAQGRNESVVLSWEAVPEADAYRIYYGIADPAENRVEVPAGTTQHVVTGLANETTYQFAMSAVSRATYHVAVSVYDNTPQRHESVLSPPASLAIGDDAESALSNVLSATPAPLDAFPPLADDDACFIATAAFGSKHAADVEILRAFRDRFLLSNAAGRWLVTRYYALSPPAARWLERHAELKPAVRIMLKPAVLVALVALEGGGAGLTVLAAAGVTGLALALRRRRARRARRSAGEAESRRPVPTSGGCFAAALAAVAASLVCAPSTADAQQGSVPPARGPLARLSSTSSPRWMYSITGGRTYVDLDDYDAFYGDDRVTSFSISGAYRLRDWLEVGARIGYRDDEGLARAPDGTVVPDAVELTVMPLHVFADFIFERPGRRIVPYAGVGVGGAWYRQEVVLQPDADGRTDVGALVRAGLRWRFGASGSREAAARPGGEPYLRSFVLLEAEHYDADKDGVELGGTAYRIGVRFEFEL